MKDPENQFGTNFSSFYKDIVQSAPVGIAVFDKISGLHYANPAFYSLTELNIAEWQALTPADSASFMQSAKSNPVSLIFIKDPQKRMWIRTIVTELGDGRTMLTLTDITEERRRDKRPDKALQAEMEEKSGFLEGLLTHLPVILYRISPEGIITSSNGAGLRVVPQWTDNMLVGLNAFDLAQDMIGSFRAAASGKLGRALNSFTIDGMEYHFDTMLFPDTANPGGIIGFAVDVTAAQRAERALNEQHQQIEDQANLLVAQNLFKDRLIAIISHDLRQPMASIMSITGLRDVSKVAFNKDELEMIFVGLNDMARKSLQLLEGILHWMRAGMSDFVYTPQPVHLRGNIEQANGVYEYDQHQKKLSFSNEIPQDTVVLAHEQMLLFVNRNLISNATRYSPNGGQIMVTTTSNIAETVVCVTDEGIGMSTEEVEHLFKLTQYSEEGAGIALSICYDLIKRMGGNIWAESTPGNGSTFCYSLPHA